MRSRRHIQSIRHPSDILSPSIQSIPTERRPTKNTAREASTRPKMERSGRISHRAFGGPDLNYLYAAERDDDDGGDISKTTQKRGRKADGRSLRGQTLYLGGEEAENGKIYCIPGHAERVLCIDTETDEVYPIGPTFDASNTILQGKYKWLRGIALGRIIYGLPCHADVVLRIDTAADAVSLLDIPYEAHFQSTEAHRQRHTPWKYHGGAVSPHDGCIYAVPQSASRVLRIDPTTDECSFVGPRFEGRCKWYGGVVGNTDGAIYAIPHNAGGVLRIDASGVAFGEETKTTSTSTTTMTSTPESRVRVTTHGEFPEGGHKWHGASASADGTIVSVPANADNVLCIVPASRAAYPRRNGDDSPAETEPALYLLEGRSDGDIATGRHRTDGKYKYLGAMAGTDGKVYCFPSGSERVLQVDTVRKLARSVGPNLRDRAMETMHQNKWQNGLTAHQEGCVYAIPLAGETVLRIRTGTPGENDRVGQTPDAAEDVEVTTWKLPWPSKTLEKWEGGVLAKNGVIYCMPNNHKAVLQIVPPCVPSRDELAKKRQEKETLRQKEREARELQKEMEKNRKRAEREARRRERKSRTNAANANGSADESADEARTDQTPDDGIHYYKYTTGIATLRSSAHRVKYSLQHRKHDPNPVIDGKATNTTFLPDELCREDVFSYCTDTHDFHSAVVRMLEASDKELVGTFQNECDDSSVLKLDSFTVPLKSLTRKCQRGNLEPAQKYLSDVVSSDSAFLSLFDSFLTNVILPHLKRRLVEAGVVPPENTVAFYCQRPPTLRIQPGPARALVRAHDDAEYGHQNGELNFWLPLTDRRKTGVDLWVESEAKGGDFRPSMAEYGQVASFHGSSCRHYVNANHSAWTRVSLDFRVGVEGYFDPHWQMIGTTDDHCRRKVTL